jgi:dual specificity MAP kinase phosphatase
MNLNTSQNCIICDKYRIDNILFNELSYCKECYDTQVKELLGYNKKGIFSSSSISKITDKLYLGDQEASEELDHLKSLNITHILVCGNYLEQHYPNDFKYLQFFINDAVEQNISEYFQQAIEFIESADKNVYVHCAAGVSRSASFVILYLMWKTKVRYDHALNLVKSKRPVCPNLGFAKQLKQYENEIFK